MKNNGKMKGFTLVETIVVMAIIGILAGILVPSLIGYVDKARKRTDASNGKQILNDIETVLYIDDSVYDGYAGKKETANEAFHRHNTSSGYRRIINTKSGQEVCDFTIIADKNGANGIDSGTSYNWKGNNEILAFTNALNKLEELPAGKTKDGGFSTPIQCKHIKGESINKWFIILRTEKANQNNTSNYSVEVWIGNDSGTPSSGTSAKNNLNPIYRVYPNPSVEYAG